MERKVLAGAGKEEIILKEEYLEPEQFAIVHRALYVRTVIVEAQNRMVFVSVELTSLPPDEIAEIKKRVADVTGTPSDGIWVSCTHTFSAPHLLPDTVLKEEERIAKKEEYKNAILDAAEASAKKAMSRMRAVKLRYGTAYCEVNTGRDVELPDGWWIGTDGKGLVDHEVGALRFDREDGRPVAVIFNYAIQSSVLDGSTLSAGGKAVSPDLAGIACNAVEQTYHESHAVALFLMGAAGDQVPVERAVSETFVHEKRVRSDCHEQGFTICETLGRKLGDAVCGAAEKAAELPVDYGIAYRNVGIAVPAKKMERDIAKLKPVKQLCYEQDGETTTEIGFAVIGNLALVGVKPELCCITAQAIKGCSPFSHTMVATMVNGASKYMADKRSYDRFTYEAQNSPFGKGAAEILAKESILQLENIYQETAESGTAGFKERHFSYSEGKELAYNLFVPKDYDPRKSYPLVLFLHDAGTCAADVSATLRQGSGATVWASEDEQRKRPCFVVAPCYPEKCAEDDFTVGWEADATVELVKSLMETYSVNKNRVYGTGQSMGCMMLCELNIRYPDFFGGCFLVAGQWNPKTMAGAKHANLWILVSEKDEKAFPIMGHCVEQIEAAGTKVSRGHWSAKLPEEEQNSIVRKIAEEKSSVNFTWFTGDSVKPDGKTEEFPGIYHVNTWARAYEVEAIREWLFTQYRTIDFSAKHAVMIRNEDGSVQAMDEPYFKAEKVAPGTWQILSDGDYSYLVEGEDEALVIDSGYGCGNIREYCQTLTDKPVKHIANTHDHFDHTANNSYFERAYMSEATEPLATRPFPSFQGVSFPRDYRIRIVREGDIIPLGADRSLEVFEIPDHAAGSLAFLDKKEKILFCGDEMCMPMGKTLNGSVERFKGYLDKLTERRDDIRWLMGGPGICDAAYMDRLLENMNYILAGHEGVPVQQGEGPVPEHGKTVRTEDGITVYDRRLPHFPEDMPPHIGKINPDHRIMDHAGIRVTYDVNNVFEQGEI